ncbi:MAG TPA: sigma 54-interacting transcriptional regulator [candidate division Zixibacteria bacterium]|nr:sigma 54-interacting transcriptional regulator [candidate division Zixibacteria bacterium]
MNDKPQYPAATEAILDSIADGVFTVDRDWRIQSFNRAASKITGIPREEAIGQQCCDVFRASICETSCALRATIESGEPIVNQAIYIINSEGEKIPVSISTAILKDADGNVIGGVETFRDLRTIEHLRRELEKRYTFHDLISKNARMLEIFDILPSIAESDSTVLIEGESGTGKELIARAIHDLSKHREGPVVTINCGALPDTLLEAELFGYKAGAFTDARQDKPGRFALAENGTIFLDEIGDISPALQVRLLRVLQERTYEPLGGTETITTNARIITATNQNLEKLVAAGKFRKDLFYRINVIKLVPPPLRERKEDIPLLINHFLDHFSSLKGKLITEISPAALSILMDHDYPGNIRELQNIIEHGFVVCRGSMITTDHLPEYLRPSKTETAHESPSLDDLEAQLIINTLRRHDWNRSLAAAELGIHKTTLWRKMKRFGIQPPE